MSGVDLDGRKVRKGAGDSIVKFVRENGGQSCRRISTVSCRRFPARAERHW